MLKLHLKPEVLEIDLWYDVLRASLVAQMVTNPPVIQKTWI